MFSLECPVFRQSQKPAEQIEHRAPAPAPAPAPKPSQNHGPSNNVKEVNERLVKLHGSLAQDLAREEQESNSKREYLERHKNELLGYKQLAVNSIIALKNNLNGLDEIEKKISCMSQNNDTWDCLEELMPKQAVHAEVINLVSQEQAYEQTANLLKRLFESKKITAESFVKYNKEVFNSYFMVSRLREKAVSSLVR